MSSASTTAAKPAPKAAAKPKSQADNSAALRAIQLPVFPYQSLGQGSFSNVKRNIKITIPLSATFGEIQRKGALEERVIRRLLHQQITSVVRGGKRVRPADDSSDDEPEATAQFNRDHNMTAATEGMIVAITSMKAHEGHSQSGAALNRKVATSGLVDFKVDVVVTTADVVFGVCPGTCVATTGPYPLTVEVDVLTTEDEKLTLLVSSTEGDIAGSNAPMFVTIEHACLRAQAFYIPRVAKGFFKMSVNSDANKIDVFFRADIETDEADRQAAARRELTK